MAPLPSADPGPLDPTAVSVAAYSAHAAAYAAAHADKVADLAAAFLTHLEPADDVILDAGCGPGRDLVRFADAGHCVLGIDANPHMVALARAATDGWPVHVTVGDLRALPYPDGHVAGTWACASLVHLDVNGALTALRELRRVTRAGGPLWVSVKTGGYTGWATTPFGRRWYQHWDLGDLEVVLAAADIAVEDLRIGDRFVDVAGRAGR